jgi:hypothetical protein
MNLEEFFLKLRFDKNHHLGLGDIRLTLAQQDELIAAFAPKMEDAERYLWLKANHLQTGPDSWIRTGDDLEEAIDAARRGK